jgi:hypothetical protein
MLLATLLARGQHARARAGFHHCEDVVGGDTLVAQRCQAQQSEDDVGTAAVEPHHGSQQRHGGLHGCDHAQGQALGFGHAQALGEQVGEQDEQRGDDGERGEEARRLRARVAQPQAEDFREMGAERPLAHDAAEHRHGVLADLHGGEVVTGVHLQAQHLVGTAVALVGELAQAQAARGGQGDFRQREECAGRDEQGDDEQALREGHGKAVGGPRRRADGRLAGAVRV